MRFKYLIICVSAALSVPAARAEGRLMPGDVRVGRHLQTFTAVDLDSPAPEGGVLLTIKSDDPAKLLLSTAPENAGSESIFLRVNEGLRASPDFWVYGVGSSGTATYTASAPGYQSGTGTATLSPSGFVFARSGDGTAGSWTTSRAGASELQLSAALLDDSLRFVGPQAVAGGRSVRVEVSSSDPSVGKILASPVVIPGGSHSALTRFQAAGPGKTTLSITAPEGFSTPAEFASIPMVVMTPGLAITTDAMIGRDLQIPAVLSLGEFAPRGGVTVVLTSYDPKRLLLAAGPTDPGTPELKIAIPERGYNARYFLQALANAGRVSYSARAPGYRDRTATVMLAPSGVVIGGPPGPPDEAHLLRQDAAEGPYGFSTSLAARDVPISLYTVQLDPVTLRSADITVQALRAGLTLTVSMENSQPAVGRIAEPRLVIQGGASMAATRFTPLRAGSTEISIATPPGFTKSSNAASLTVHVQPHDSNAPSRPVAAAEHQSR